MDQRLFLIRALLTDRREDYDSKIIDLTQKFFDLVYTRHAAALEALYQQRTRMHPQYTALRQQGELLRQQHDVLYQQRSAALAQAGDEDQRLLLIDLYNQYETILDEVTEQHQEVVTEFGEGFYEEYRHILNHFLDASDNGLYDLFNIDGDHDVLEEAYENALDDLESQFDDAMDDYRDKLQARFGEDYADLFEEFYDVYTDAFGELCYEIKSSLVTPDDDTSTTTRSED